MADPTAFSRLHRPPARLRPYVGSYVGYRYEGFSPGVHIGTPSRHLTFVVSFDRPVDVCLMPDPRRERLRMFAIASGLHAGPALIRHDGNEHGIQLQITPAGARALFGLPAGELATTVVSLDELLGPLASELLDRLDVAPGWSARFAVLDDVLERAIGDLPPTRPELRVAWDRLVASAGTVEVASLAADVGWSRRHLSDRFRNEYGQAPKVMGRVMRFERARALLAGPEPPPLAQVAATTGYADQAHLTREWREFVGATPTAWLQNEEFPFVQDSEAVDQAV